MSIIPLDISKGNLIPDGNYPGVVQAVTYQIKTGEKWNREGTTDVETIDEMMKFDGDKRLNYRIGIEGKGSLFNAFYLKDSAKGFLTEFFNKCGADKGGDAGFDPEAVLNKDVGVKVGIDGEYNNIEGFYKL